MTLVMPTDRRASARLISCALAAAVLTGCGPGEPAEVTLELTGNDQMKFSVERFEVDAPAVVTVTLENVGSMPKVSMGHNLVLLKQGVDVLEFASECLSSGAVAENDFLPEQVRGQALAWTKVLGPNERDSFVVEIDEPGSYPYVCTFPGHFVNMKGVIVAR
jgi:azurin